MSAVPSLPEGVPRNGFTNGATNGVHGYQSSDATIENLRPLKVIVIGAGYSGIYHAIRIPERLRNVELVVYEKNAGLGGTWYENRYLGCACDIPSHSYQYSFEPNPDWSAIYAPAREIQAYLERTAKKYSADRFIKLEHEVVECRWDDAVAKWNVTVKDLKTGEITHDQSDMLISARGNLNNPQWPEIEGLNTFKGELMHSATWNEKYDFTNKRIGVIGSGSSSIQIVPSLQRIAGTHVSAFVRGKTWISPPFSGQLWEKHAFDPFNISPEIRKRWIENPDEYEKFRLEVEEDINSIFSFCMKGSPAQLGGKQLFEENMKKALASKPEIFEAIKPDFSPGCRRLTPGPGYLEALTKPNVDFVQSQITKISEGAIHTADGKVHEIDALVCATGFKASQAPPFPVIGANNLSMAQKWAGHPNNYLSHSIAGFPNFFTMYGANSATGSGSLVVMIENVADYVIKAIRKIQKENIASMVVKPEREADFVEYADNHFKKTVFSENCNSWYKSKEGRVSGLWPGSSLHCIESMRSPRWEDFDYVYRDELGTQEYEEEIRQRMDGMSVSGTKKRRANRMKWLGNGLSVHENEHKAYYLYDGILQKPVAPRPEEHPVHSVHPWSY